jgi:bacteriorhodopsin
MKSTLLYSMPGGGEWIFIFVILLIILFCLLDIFRSEFRRPGAKQMWIVAVVFFPLLGCLLYYWIGTEQKVASKG